jgi:hypothetical protein
MDNRTVGRKSVRGREQKKSKEESKGGRNKAKGLKTRNSGAVAQFLRLTISNTTFKYAFSNTTFKYAFSNTTLKYVKGIRRERQWQN